MSLAGGVGWSSRARVVGLLIVVLLAGGLAAVPLKAAQPGGGSRDVPLLPSQAGPAPERERPTVDRTDGPASPSEHRPLERRGNGFDAATSRELPEQTTESKRVFKNRDGSYTTELSAGVARVKGSDGRFHDVDLTLSDAGDGTFRPAVTPRPMSVARSSRDDLTATQLDDGTALSLTIEGMPPGRAAALAKRQGRSSAVFAGVLADGGDVEVAPTTVGIETTYVLRTQAAASRPLRERLRLPDGWSARQAGPVIEVVDAGGAVRATWQGGMGEDAADPPAQTLATLELERVAGGQATARVMIDQAFLAVASYPVRIDPQLSANTTGASGGFDTWVNDAYPTYTGYYTFTELQAGRRDGVTNNTHSLVFFQLGAIPADSVVTASTLQLSVLSTLNNNCFANTGATVKRLASGWGQTTVSWNNHPAVDGATPASFLGTFCPNYTLQVNVQSFVNDWVRRRYPNNGFALYSVNESDGTKWMKFRSAEAGTGIPTLQVTWNRIPSAPAIVSPADGSTVTANQPVLSVGPSSDPDGDTVYYYFRVATGADGISGEIVANSGWKTSRDFTIPPRALVSGKTYYWTVWAYDWVSDASKAPSLATAWRFTYDLRLGAGTPAPLDTVGPLTTNLATGNLMFQYNTPVLRAAGGDLGASLTYNSHQEPDAGLIGEYRNETSGDYADNAEPVVLRRLDQYVDFDWGSGSPDPVVSADNFSVHWTGYVAPSDAGDYEFGVSSDDGAKIVVVSGGATYPAFDDLQTGSHAMGTPIWGGTRVPLDPGSPAKIDVYLHEGGGSAGIHLYIRALFSGGPAAGPLPPSWLSSSTNTLPDGWRLSAELDDGDLAYSEARSVDGSIILVEPDGTTHEFTAVAPAAGVTTGAVGYRARHDEDDVVSKDPATNEIRVLADDGRLYRFGTDGKLLSVLNYADPTKPAGIVTEYVGSPPRLNRIYDPSSTRQVSFVYRTSSGTCPDSNAPPGQLCRIDYSDGTSTSLIYTPTSTELARIAGPGGETWDLGWNGQQLTALRTPLVYDAIAAGKVPDDNTTRLLVDYDLYSRTGGRVISIQQPLPEPGNPAGAPRPERDYRYPNASQTQVTDIGIGVTRTVDYDAAGRQTASRDSTGRTTTQEWDSLDRLVATVDPASLKTVTQYDAASRVTDVWGPSPTGCFNGLTPLTTQGCPNIPHTHTGYDEGLQGLAVTVWSDNDPLKPKLQRTGTAGLNGTRDASAAIAVDWQGSGPSGVAPDQFSVRFSGELTVPQTTTYTFRFESDDTVRLTIDDQVVLDSTTPGAASTVRRSDPITLAAGAHRVRVDYRELSGDASIRWYWTPQNQAETLVPLSAVTPRYGLVTSTLTDDGDATSSAPSVRTTTAYAQPESGQPTAVTNGADLPVPLTTRYDYEDSGLRRLVAETLPAGNTTTSAYYGTAPQPSARTVPCAGASAAAIDQAGMLATRTSPGRVEEFVYDARGRVAATQIGGTGWRCTTYDDRGRVVSQNFPADGDQPARTVTSSYADAGGDPRVTTTSDANATITTTVDLLGRPIAYASRSADGTAYTSTMNYDAAGRLVRTASPGGTLETTYDADGRPTSQRLDGLTVATAGYDAAGELHDMAYPAGTGNGGNGTTGLMLRDDAGRVSHLEWRRASDNALLASNDAAHSRASRVINEQIDGTSPNPNVDTYAYDAAGRLVRAEAPGHTYTYGYGPAACGVAAAGQNTNRTLATDNGVATTYCYDSGDRLTSTSDPTIATNIAYDARGNTIRLGSETIGYDGADRHITTTVDSGVAVRYVRDPADRIIARYENDALTARYGYTADGDTPAFTLDAAGNAIERTIVLVGGVILTKRSNGNVWSYPNIHGDVMATADGTGNKQGPTVTYEPYGHALAASPDNSAGNLDYAWLGSKQRPLEHADGIETIEMGARQYNPRLGRFLEVDPIEGGSANDYDYVDGDPVNSFDLDGTRCWTGKNKNGSCRSLSRGVRRVARRVNAVGEHVDASVGFCAGICFGFGMQGNTPYWYHGGGLVLSAGANVGVTSKRYKQRECSAQVVSGSVGGYGVYLQQGQGNNYSMNSRDWEGGWAPGLGGGYAKLKYHGGGC